MFVEDRGPGHLLLLKAPYKCIYYIGILIRHQPMTAKTDETETR